jgi:hypothetical protein
VGDIDGDSDRDVAAKCSSMLESRAMFSGPIPHPCDNPFDNTHAYVYQGNGSGGSRFVQMLTDRTTEPC